jgi:SNF2 family DNA or RNA helicase
MDVTEARPDGPRIDFGEKQQSQTPPLRQGLNLPMATPSPANMDVETNKKKELPRTVSLSSNESVDKEQGMITPGTENAEIVDLTSDNGTLSSNTEQNEVRLSHRVRKSTLVYIDGQAVLAKNNYQMKGLTYEYREDYQTAPPEKKPKSTAARPKAPKPKTELETKRINHNCAVKGRVESKAELRSQYLSSHLCHLQPFLDESVTARLEQVSVVSSLDTPELFMQPSAIQADMRDYQLDGLNWMVRMNKANLGMILGDEMGLVSCILRAS